MSDDSVHKLPITCCCVLGDCKRCGLHPTAGGSVHKLHITCHDKTQSAKPHISVCSVPRNQWAYSTSGRKKRRRIDVCTNTLRSCLSCCVSSSRWGSASFRWATEGSSVFCVWHWSSYNIWGIYSLQILEYLIQTVGHSGI